MAANNNMEMMINFIVNLSADKSKLELLAKETEKILSKSNPEIKFDTTSFKKEITELGNALQDVDFDIDAVNAEISIQKITDAVNQIKKVDLSTVLDSLDVSGVDKLFDNLEENLNALGSESFFTEIENLSKEFEQADTEAKQFLNTQKLALVALESTGKKGSDAYNKLEKEIGEAEGALKKIGLTNDSTSKSFSERLATFGLAAQGIQTFANAANQIGQPFVELDTATQRIKSLGGAARENALVFREMSLEMAKEVPIGAEALQTATYDALSAGINATKEDITSFMSAAAKLAVGSGESVGNTVNLLSSLVNAYGESATKTGEYSDVLFTTVNLGKTTIQELSSSMSEVIPTAAAYGFNLKNVGASLALMTANGIPTAQATTKLNQLMIEMQKPGAELSKILNNAGISAASLGAKVKSGDVIGALKDMDGAFKQAGLSATQAFSSNEAGAAFNVLTKDFDKLQGTMDSFQNAAGSTEAAYKDMSQSVANQTAQMTARMDAAFIGAIDSLGPVGTGLVTVSQQLGKMEPLISSITGLGSLLPVDMMKKFAVSILGLIPGFTAAGATGTATGAAVSTAWLTVVAPIAAVVAALAGLYLFFTKTEKGVEIAKRIGASFEKMWQAAKPAFEGMVNYGEALLNTLVSIGEALYEWIITPFELGIEVITAIIDAISDMVGAGEESTSIFEQIGKSYNVAAKAMTSLGDVFRNLTKYIKETKATIVAFIQNAPEVFGVLFDYAKYYLNPANWISGDDAFEKKLASRMTNVIKKIKDTAAESLKNPITIDTKVPDPKKDVEGMVNAFVKSKQETEEFIAKNKLALQAMEFNGKKGTEAYKKIEQAVKEAEKALKKFNQTPDGPGTGTGDKLNKVKKTALELAKEEIALETKKANLALQNTEQSVKQKQLNESRKSTAVEELFLLGEQSKALNKQKESWTDLLNKKGLVKTDAEKIDIETIIQNLNSEIQKNQENVQNIEIKIKANDKDAAKEIEAFRQEYYDELLADLEVANEKEINALDKKHDKELEKLREFRENYLEGTLNTLSDDKKAENDKLTAEEKRKFSELEALNKNGLISAEEYESTKFEIEESYKKKRAESEEEFRKLQVIANEASIGLEMELTRKHDAESLTIEKDKLSKKLDLLKESAQAFDAQGKPLFSNMADKEGYDALKLQLEETEKLLQEKGTDIGIFATGMTDAVNSSLTDLFSGDTDAIADNWREFLSQMAGMLQAKMAGFVLDLVLSPGVLEFIGKIPPPFNLAALAVVHTAVSGAVKAISDPLLNSMLSFSSGGRIDSPTALIAGDGAKLGSRNREWIFNDPQLIATVQMAAMGSNMQLVHKLANIEYLLSTMNISTQLQGRDIKVSYGRTDVYDSRRAR